MSETKEYQLTIIVESCEEGGYFATCPSLPGCHVQGETYEEVMAEIRASIKSFICDCIQGGEPVGENDVTVESVKITV
ncbi:MAG: type II toxin-antitoxin system HicB family antitoxin [Candidatus Magnetobacterium sp. LHC-1]|uniref:Type II toxin-antitoxin system HicB family antitoxin n=1 Tax=Candidatus Magnetobacterium casense TaxID=1455061 RepID=A0ABS6S065_9BACT|nr:type II toxin-antitoxin system HicB family antitoxin [Candidatus Magnetobacterium casensis]MBF0608298.1 type II toxin-antitoxin system HicB family antitoxin [Nitrospirota bacterium]MBV6342191.1 type II toxin-antitoxin system HicB family antitoxin [Candidatus Magnetobacterium casensis]